MKAKVKSKKEKVRTAFTVFGLLSFAFLLLPFAF